MDGRSAIVFLQKFDPKLSVKVYAEKGADVFRIDEHDGTICIWDKASFEKYMSETGKKAKKSAKKSDSETTGE